MITIAIINEKGGVGKTTTAINLASGLARRDHRVLVLDLDPQSNTTAGLGLNPHDYRQQAVGDALLIENPDMRPFVVSVEEPPLDIIPATRDLRGIAHELVEQGGPIDRLEQALSHLTDHYDYAILDLPPTLEIIQENAIQTADRFIIPIELSAFSLDGLTELIQHLRSRKASKAGWEFRILPSRVEGFSQESNRTTHEDLQPLAAFVLKSTIRFSGKIPLAQREGRDIFFHAPRSRAARDFRALTHEIETLWPAPSQPTL